VTPSGETSTQAPEVDDPVVADLAVAGLPRPRWRRRISWLAVAFALPAAFSIAANVVVQRSARPYLHGAPTDVPSRDMAIVPGASVHRDGTPSPQLEERLATALDLLKRGRVRAVLVSGAHRGAYDEAGPMRRWLVQRGASSRLVFEDHAGFRTLDTMERAAKIFRVTGAIVCTQAFHLPRAVFLARRAGIDALGVVADVSARTTGPNDRVREWFARVEAVVDSYILHRGPREDSPAPGSAGLVLSP
jgi:SanA protein